MYCVDFQVEMVGNDVSDYVHENDRQLLLDYCNAMQSVDSSSNPTSSCSANNTG